MFTLLRGTAEAHGHLLTLRSHLVFRTAASLAAYLFLSLMYTLIALAFGAPMTGRYSQGVGFVVLWMLNWCTMGACGLVMEAVFTIVGMKWAVFFLNFWLIVNASGGFASVEVMPEFYRFGYGVPFFHAVSGDQRLCSRHRGFGGLRETRLMSLRGRFRERERWFLGRKVDWESILESWWRGWWGVGRVWQ